MAKATDVPALDEGRDVEVEFLDTKARVLSPYGLFQSGEKRVMSYREAIQFSTLYNAGRGTALLRINEITPAKPGQENK